jgi:hypothetical protein
MSAANNNGDYDDCIELGEDVQTAVNAVVDIANALATQSIDFAFFGDHCQSGSKNSLAIAVVCIQASSALYAAHTLASAIDRLAQQMQAAR